MWYVYFLQLRNGDIYVGSTNDPYPAVWQRTCHVTKIRL